MTVDLHQLYDTAACVQQIEGAFLSLEGQGHGAGAVPEFGRRLSVGQEEVNGGVSSCDQSRHRILLTRVYPHLT